MTVKQYRKRLSTKLIDNFIEEYHHKIGIRPVVSVPRKYSKKILSLEELEAVINRFIPDNIKKNFPTIKNKNRTQFMADLRKIYAFLGHVEYKYTASAVARHIGQDHSTVLHNKEQFVKMINSDEQFTALYEKIIHFIKTNDVSTIL